MFSNGGKVKVNIRFFHTEVTTEKELLEKGVINNYILDSLDKDDYICYEVDVGTLWGDIWLMVKSDLNKIIFRDEEVKNKMGSEVHIYYNNQKMNKEATLYNCGFKNEEVISIKLNE